MLCVWEEGSCAKREIVESIKRSIVNGMKMDRNRRVSIRKCKFLFKIEACEKNNRSRIFDILGIVFRA